MTKIITNYLPKYRKFYFPKVFRIFLIGKILNIIVFYLKRRFFRSGKLQNVLFLKVANLQILQIMNFRKLKISYFVKNMKAVPKLTLSGEWLKKAGFEAGKNVQLEIVNNQIIIKNAD